MIYCKLLLTAVFWGGTFIAGRSLAGSVDPFAAAFLRFVTASVFLVILTVRREGSAALPRPNQILPILMLGATGVFAYNISFFKGLQLIEAGRASVIIANNPVFIAIFSALIFRERLGWLRSCGVVLSVCGAIVAISKGNLSLLSGDSVGWGEFFILCCVASWVTFSLLRKTVMDHLSPLVSVTHSAVAGVLLLAVPAWSHGVFSACRHYSLSDWTAIFYLGFFGTVLGFVWYYEGIEKIGPTRAGLFINFVPISAIAMAWGILGEPVTWSLLFGLLLVTTGVYLTNKKA